MAATPAPAKRSTRGRGIKRIIDVVGALVALVLFAPLLLLITLAVKFTSPGPILFRQARHGHYGSTFIVFKFRTMVTSSGDVGFQQARKGDSRITFMGRFLRRLSFDELPQLFNILRGDMSLVGPRPHAIEHNELFERNNLRVERRHSVKPGMTGWAQVNGLRGPTDSLQKMKQRLDYDLYYVDNWSLAFDFKILLLTLSAKARRNSV